MLIGCELLSHCTRRPDEPIVDRRVQWPTVLGAEIVEDVMPNLATLRRRQIGDRTRPLLHFGFGRSDQYLDLQRQFEL